MNYVEVLERQIKALEKIQDLLLVLGDKKEEIECKIAIAVEIRRLIETIEKIGGTTHEI